MIFLIYAFTWSSQDTKILSGKLYESLIAGEVGPRMFNPYFFTLHEWLSFCRKAPKMLWNSDSRSKILCRVDSPLVSGKAVNQNSSFTPGGNHLTELC